MTTPFFNFDMMIDTIGNPLSIPVYFTTPQELGIGSSMATSLLKPGYLVSVVNGEHGCLNFMIRRTQKRLLKDHSIIGKFPEEILTWASYFSHAFMHMKRGSFVEMYAPCAHYKDYNSFSPGQLLLVSVPLLKDGIEPSQNMLDKITYNAEVDVVNKTPYSIKELFYFYFYSWEFQKLWIGRHFEDIFKDKKNDVCSGRYTYWTTQAGIWSKDRIWPEGAYPALLVLERTLTKPLYLVQFISEEISKDLFKIPAVV